MRTEDDLRAALLTLEADAPTVDEVLDRRAATSQTARGARRWLLPAVAATLVAALAVTVVGLSTRGNGHRGQPTASRRPSPAPAELVHVDWVLVRFRLASTWTSPEGTGRELFISRNGGFQADLLPNCVIWLGTSQLRHGSANFTGREGAMSCPPQRPLIASDLDAVQAVERVLEGSARWTVENDTLTITKTGVGELVYRRGAADPPSS
jgi:hypothetical protein